MNGGSELIVMVFAIRLVAVENTGTTETFYWSMCLFVVDSSYEVSTVGV
ncbi:hypothetical protein HTG_04570 [Natrinema mahii]|nr:hypothetical protein HTG_04570 [Natrinema mahii]